MSRLLRDLSDACACLISVTLGSPSGRVVSFSHDSGRVRAKGNVFLEMGNRSKVIRII